MGNCRRWARIGMVAGLCGGWTACASGVMDDDGNPFGPPGETTPAGNSSTPLTTGASGVSDDAAGTGGADDAGTGGVDGPSSADGADGVADDGGTTGEPPPAGECGNGVIDEGEACDGPDLGTASCAGEGFGDGVLACAENCTLITDACYTCGDGQIDLVEQCDGVDFDGVTCTSLGFGGGNLACAPGCTEIDTSGCLPLASCGDGVVNGGEQCDGADLGGNSCVTQGYDLGVLGCTPSCVLDVSGCMDDLAGCGEQGDFCIFDKADLQSTCCPAGVGGNVLGICDVIFCV